MEVASYGILNASCYARNICLRDNRLTAQESQRTVRVWLVPLPLFVPHEPDSGQP